MKLRSLEKVLHYPSNNVYVNLITPNNVERVSLDVLHTEKRNYINWSDRVVKKIVIKNGLFCICEVYI